MAQGCLTSAEATPYLEEQALCLASVLDKRREQRDRQELAHQQALTRPEINLAGFRVFVEQGVMAHNRTQAEDSMLKWHFRLCMEPSQACPVM